MCFQLCPDFCTVLSIYTLIYLHSLFSTDIFLIISKVGPTASYFMYRKISSLFNPIICLYYARRKNMASMMLLFGKTCVANKKRLTKSLLTGGRRNVVKNTARYNICLL
jgi:hypothetical protein